VDAVGQGNEPKYLGQTRHITHTIVRGELEGKTTWQNYAWWEGNIKLNLRERMCENEECISFLTTGSSGRLLRIGRWTF